MCERREVSGGSLIPGGKWSIWPSTETHLGGVIDQLNAAKWFRMVLDSSAGEPLGSPGI